MNKNVLSCLLKDGKGFNAVMLVGRLYRYETLTERHLGDVTVTWALSGGDWTSE